MNPRQARPIDWEKVGRMFIGGANITQAAASVGVSRNTLYTRCRTDNKMPLDVYWKEKHEEGNNMLHIAQYEKAIEDKNPTMLIWLGKQRLGQKENVETATTNLAELKDSVAKGLIKQEKEITEENLDDIIEDLEA